jgi:hypothetical protein
MHVATVIQRQNLKVEILHHQLQDQQSKQKAHNQ